jgi:two-component system, sensor histidine kinase and response regulator
MISRWGGTASSADGALQGMAMLSEATEHNQAFDVILLDLNMPDIDGYGLARLVQADERVNGVPMVMLTSSAQRGEATKAERSGIAAYLTKPVRAFQLKSTLATVLGSVANPHVTGQPAPLAGPTSFGSTTAMAPSQPQHMVLVVEDNLVNQKVLTAMLTNIGYRVSIAVNGSDALAYLDHHRYAAVLMDCQMPVLDGYRATEELRRREGADRHTPVIALTASAMADDRTRCLNAGMDDYLTKPINSDRLAAALAQAVPTDGLVGGAP